MRLLIYDNLQYFKLGARSKNQGFTTKFDETSFGHKTFVATPEKTTDKNTEKYLRYY